MTERENLYKGLTYVIWGYIFLYFDIKINEITFLPDFVAYFFFLSAIKLLKEEEKELSLIIRFGIILCCWDCILWFGKWASLEISMAPISLIISIISLYFHFQLITNLASIAAKYQPEDSDISEKLLKYRTVQTVILTILSVSTVGILCLKDIWAYFMSGMGIVYLIAGVCLIYTLYQLRKCFIEEKILD